MAHTITLIPGDGIGPEVEAICGRERNRDSGEAGDRSRNPERSEGSRS
jgi:hypothetical protein